MPQRVIQVDAFTDRPFRGNPAAVCVLDAAGDAAWMADVAREMNLSETAYVLRRGDGDWDLRWFTPDGGEVDLCGHATLASAHVLWTEGHVQPGRAARFQTRSGLLTCLRDGAAISMDFPSHPPGEPLPRDRTAAPDLIAALHAEPVEVRRTRFDLFVVLSSAEEVRSLRPDMTRLAEMDARGVIVTARGDAGYDVVSRFFAPRLGIPEDPVTGSAHCAIGPYWMERLGRFELRCYQASARGGEVGVRVLSERVELTGRAVTVMRGEIL